jgi:hypothetical protein
MLEYGLWKEEQETELVTILPKHIEYWKVELFKAAFRTKERQTFRLHLATAKTELNRLYNLRHSFDHATCAGIANYAKFQYIVEKSTFYSNGKKYNWNKTSPYLALTYYQDNIISEDDLREISHTTPWENIWSAGKKNGRLFEKPGVELTQEQQRLIMWSSMYDSIKDYTDCPADEIINDDDMLDGWLILKRQERENNMTQNQAGQLIKNDKIANSDEIYLVANTIDDAKKVDRLNTNFARDLKKKRFNFIEKKGEVSEVSLPDVQQRLSMELTQVMMASAKGNK